MKKLICIAALVLPLCAQSYKVPQVIAKDSNGVVVQIKEKYGSYTIDTCTVVMLMNNYFVVVHREGESGWYPASFHSVAVMERLKGRNEEPVPEGETSPEVLSETKKSVAPSSGELAYTHDLEI